jgi:hypothetical protein
LKCSDLRNNKAILYRIVWSKTLMNFGVERVLIAQRVITADETEFWNVPLGVWVLFNDR